VAAFLDDDDEDMKEDGVAPAPAAPAPLASGSEKERLFVQVALPLLSNKRRIDYESWMKVGFAVATVYGGSERGRDLFRIWSQQAVNYDQGACDKVYACAGKRVGVGSLVSWLHEDAPSLAGALVQMLRDEDAEEKVDDAVSANTRATEPSKLDEKHLHALVREYNAGVAARRADPDRDAGAAKALDQELLRKLQLDIVRYMNKWICIIRRSTGRPNIIEEYSRLEPQSTGAGHDVVTMFTLRSPSDASAAYKKHTLLITGEKPRNPIDIWLSHKESRDFDSVNFIPAGCDDKSVFNLFRGLAITRDAAAACTVAATPIIEHVQTIWCHGDQRVADFLFDWMAHLIQKPGVKMASAPVLKGGQGAGKSIVMQKLGDIIGAEHFLGVRSIDSVTGSFQEDKVKTNLLTVHFRWRQEAVECAQGVDL
jgi:hypothetical protein